MAATKLYTSEEILGMNDLHELADSFGSSGIPFTYQLTRGELFWVSHVKDRYSIHNWIKTRVTEEGILLFCDPGLLTEALKEDGMHPKAVMLSDDTALQRLFFWIS